MSAVPSSKPANFETAVGIRTGLSPDAPDSCGLASNIPPEDQARGMEGGHGLMLAAEDHETDLPDHRVVPLDQGCEGEPCGVAAASRSALEQLPVRQSGRRPRVERQGEGRRAVRFRRRITSSASLVENPSPDDAATQKRFVSGVHGRSTARTGTRGSRLDTGATGDFPSRLSTLADGT